MDGLLRARQTRTRVERDIARIVREEFVSACVSHGDGVDVHDDVCAGGGGDAQSDEREGWKETDDDYVGAKLGRGCANEHARERRVPRGWGREDGDRRRRWRRWSRDGVEARERGL